MSYRLSQRPRANLLVLAAILIAADARAQSASADTLDPRLETGCSGGVTGGGGGTTVTPDGRFFRWERGGPSPGATPTLTLIRRDEARAAKLFATAERAGLTSIKYSEPSNMTCFLTLVRNGQSYHVAWPWGTTPRRIRALVQLSKEIQAPTS